ncbi:MAG: hypothetical protein J0H44_15140 [Alphaproteobacteria bacterium]|nr:hypothetical protein [Alphaproteobacteria bacterium]
MTRSEAHAALDAALEARRRLGPVQSRPLFLFAMEMSQILQFPSVDPVADIEAWATTWLEARVVRDAFPTLTSTRAESSPEDQSAS